MNVWARGLAVGIVVGSGMAWIVQTSPWQNPAPATASSYKGLTYDEYRGMPYESRTLFVRGLVEGMTTGILMSKSATTQDKDMNTVLNQFGDCINRAETFDDVIKWATERIRPSALEVPNAPVGALLSMSLASHCGF